MRLVDVFLTFPSILIVLAIVAMLGAGLQSVIIGLCGERSKLCACDTRRGVVGACLGVDRCGAGAGLRRSTHYTVQRVAHD